jgi:hypothetical protein
MKDVVEEAKRIVEMRREVGLRAYGKPVEDADYTVADFFNEAICEAADLLIYLTAIRNKIISQSALVIDPDDPDFAEVEAAPDQDDSWPPDFCSQTGSIMDRKQQDRWIHKKRDAMDAKGATYIRFNRSATHNPPLILVEGWIKCPPTLPEPAFQLQKDRG